MLLVHPVAIETTPASTAGARVLWATWAIALAVAMAFACDRLAAWSLTHGGPLNENAARTCSLAVASARLYPQPELFSPWEPWSYPLVHDGWWHLLADLAALLLVGSALERRLGSTALVATALTIAPIVGAAAIITRSEPGLSGVVCGWFALLLARDSHAQVRWAMSYYAITVVGQVPLVRVPLAVVFALFLAQEGTRLAWTHHGSPWAWWGAAIIAGAALGHASRRLQPGGGAGVEPPK